MSPQVVAAIIAASISLLTLIGTLAAQYVGHRATSRDTQKALDRTLAQQRTQALNERFATAAEQLGDDKPPAVQLAGVYAMASLADEWKINRQTCVNVLCGYLRMPYEPDPGHEAPEAAQRAFRARREVRHTVMRVIAARLNRGAAEPWDGVNLDFTGVVFDGGDFGAAEFSGGRVSFDRAKFADGEIRFDHAEFTGGQVSFDRAEFTGGQVRFDHTVFAGGHVSFDRAAFFDGQVRFDQAVFTDGQLSFDRAVFDGSEIEICFDRAGFVGGNVHFTLAEFSDGQVSFDNARFSGGSVNFFLAQLSGGRVNFDGAEFSGGEVRFDGTQFSDGEARFDHARFSGAQVTFDGAKFSGGEVEFSHALDWSIPPVFDWPADAPPQGVKLPGTQDQPQP